MYYTSTYLGLILALHVHWGAPPVTLPLPKDSAFGLPCHRTRIHNHVHPNGSPILSTPGNRRPVINDSYWKKGEVSFRKILMGLFSKYWKYVEFSKHFERIPPRPEGAGVFFCIVVWKTDPFLTIFRKKGPSIFSKWQLYIYIYTYIYICIILVHILD